MPGWLRGIGKAFPFTFSSQVTLVNQFSGRHFDCTPVDVASGKCIAKTGDDFLQSINIQSWDNGNMFITSGVDVFVLKQVAQDDPSALCLLSSLHSEY